MHARGKSQYNQQRSTTVRSDQYSLCSKHEGQLYLVYKNDCGLGERLVSILGPKRLW